MKVALVHDFLTKFGGAEKVFVDLARIFPDAPIYTLFFDQKMAKHFPGKVIHTSRLQRMYNLIRWPKALLPQMVWAIEEFDFSDFDVVITSSNTVGHGILTKPETIHICYCHSPVRYVWDTYHTYLRDQRLPGWFARIVEGGLSKIRLWDKDSADRVNIWLANSENVARRIKKFYRQDSRVVCPGIDLPDKVSEVSADYFLVLSRLSPYKRIDLAIEVFNELGLPLVIAGTGEDEKRLRAMAGPTIEFTGFVSAETKHELMSHARALIFPGEDDFGIVPVEAMGYGKPVIAFNKGGATETVIDGSTGILFDEPTAGSLREAIERFFDAEEAFDRDSIREFAEKFSTQRFEEEIREIVASARKPNQSDPASPI